MVNCSDPPQTQECLTQTALPEVPTGIYLRLFTLTGLKTLNLFQNWCLCTSLLYNLKKKKAPYFLDILA